MKNQITQNGSLKFNLPRGLAISEASLTSIQGLLGEFLGSLASFGVPSDNVSVEMESPGTLITSWDDARRFFHHYRIMFDPTDTTIRIHLEDGTILETKVTEWRISRTFSIYLSLEPIPFREFTLDEIYMFLHSSLGGPPAQDRMQTWKLSTEEGASSSGPGWDITSIQFI